MSPIAQGDEPARNACAPSSRSAPARWRRRRDAAAAAEVPGAAARRLAGRTVDNAPLTAASLRHLDRAAALVSLPPPDRPPAALGRRARAHLAAKRAWRRRLAPHQLRQRRWRARAHRAGAARPRPVGPAPAGDPVRQRPRAPAAGLGAMFAGVPFAPISPAYSTVSQDYGKLRHILGMLTPGWYSPSATAAGRLSGGGDRHGGGAGAGRDRGRHTLAFDDLLARPATARGGRGARQGRPGQHRQVPVHLGFDQAAQGRDQHAAHAVRQPAADPAVLPGLGRGAAGAGRLAALEPHLRRQPQRRPDDVQRRHALHRRGQAHARRWIHETLRNLREISPTVYFNVPKGFEEIANAMESDAERCATGCSRASR